ncbi:uncharacterized protein LOC117647230 [Thrips palmi]|uniref:Uncharacterized protein LOC117647230 n=1 Tax=Thrips palmi TaxID=161013 RepID=A0A6P8Z4Q8_THRPL|nr:uncharacterized protein LOC117647230 [Thrips palmi]
MHTTAPTSPQLAVYVKLLCLLMVVICGAAVPMEEKVRLFNEKTKGFMEASRKGHFVSARNVTLSKFTNLTIRSTNEIGVVELVFADVTPPRHLCIDKTGKLKAQMKKRRPGCLFRECVDGNYFFYLTSHPRPRLLGFHGHDQYNPLGPPRCCDMTRDGEHGDGEHLVPDAAGGFSCQRRRVPRSQVDYFFFLKKRGENATLADAIPAHNTRQGGHNRSPASPAGPADHHLSPHHADDPARRPPHHQQHQQQHQQRHRGQQHQPEWQPQPSERQLQRRHHRKQQQQQLQQQLQQQQPHRTRHHHHLTMPARTPRPLVPLVRPVVRVRHRKKPHPREPARDAPHDVNQLPWD